MPSASGGAVGMTVLVAVLGLALLVFVHELGHFLAALAVGIRPRRFYVGFPPAVWKTTRNGVEYGVGAVPFGGLVALPGMTRPEPIDVQRGLRRAVTELPALAPEAARLRSALERRDDAEARECIRALRRLVEMHGHESRAVRRAVTRLADLEAALGSGAYWRTSVWRRVVVILAGPAANALLALVVFAALFMTYDGQPTATVAAVTPGSPAARSGLLAGDRVVSIDGRRVKADQIRSRLALSTARPVVLVVERGEALVTLRSAPASDRGLVLAGAGLSAPAAVARSLELGWQVTRELGKALAGLVVGERRDEVSSAVGIVHVSSDAARDGPHSFFAVLALVSLSVALINLLPLLPLDGGHIAFAIGEGLGGTAARRQFYERVSIIGFGIVLILLVVGVSNDIDRLS